MGDFDCCAEPRKRNTIHSLACQDGDCGNCHGCACRCHAEAERP